MIPPAQRQPIADLWFATMFARFKRDSRSGFDSPLTDKAERLSKKLQESTGQLTFQRILAEISSFIALSSGDAAQAYLIFWDAIINRRQPVSRRSSTPRRAAVNQS
jgi:hypothetical protein